ncbi:MAG: PHB depolymerase family esterase [Burkholderiaceae bacterium]
MAKRLRTSAWTKLLTRSAKVIARRATRTGMRALVRSLPPKPPKRKPAPATGHWITGLAVGSAGARRFWLYRPPGVVRGERLPLLVMLHGCGQNAKGFALSTRMNSVAARERFCVLYPEQDRLANAQGCWNWFDTRSGRAQGEAALVVNAIDQVCLLHPVDRERVAVAGLSAGASMAALLATRHPERFKAVAMHSGVPPGTAHSTLSALGAMHGRRGTPPLPASPATLAVPWPPLLVIHGTADHLVSADNGRAAAQVWAAAAGAVAGAARRVQRGQRHAMLVTDFKRRGRTAATLVEVESLGHAWSGGAARQPFSDPRGPDASRMIWAFASRQFERSAQVG